MHKCFDNCPCGQTDAGERVQYPEEESKMSETRLVTISEKQAKRLRGLAEHYDTDLFAIVTAYEGGITREEVEEALLHHHSRSNPRIDASLRKLRSAFNQEAILGEPESAECPGSYPGSLTVIVPPSHGSSAANVLAANVLRDDATIKRLVDAGYRVRISVEGRA